MNIYGKCEFKPTKAMEAEFDKGIEKINSSYGFHMVHIFSKDVICGEMDVRKAYFEGFGDAECYAYEYDEAHKDNKRSYVICIDKEVYRARLFGDDTDIFKGMAGDRKGITDYEKGQHDELQKVVKMLGHYIRTAENATLEKAYDNLHDQLFCMEALNGLRDGKGDRT